MYKWYFLGTFAESEYINILYLGEGVNLNCRKGTLNLKMMNSPKDRVLQMRMGWRWGGWGLHKSNPTSKWLRQPIVHHTLPMKATVAYSSAICWQCWTWRNSIRKDDHKPQINSTGEKICIYPYHDSDECVINFVWEFAKICQNYGQNGTSFIFLNSIQKKQRAVSNVNKLLLHLNLFKVFVLFASLCLSVTNKPFSEHWGRC